MGRMCLLTLFLTLLMAPSLAQAGPARKEAKKDHPGCLVLWFLKDCPLAKVLGVDPFGLYNWKSLCQKYSAFREMKRCEKYLTTEEVEAQEQETGDDEEVHETKEPESDKVDMAGDLSEEGDEKDNDYYVIDGIGPRTPAVWRERSRR